MGKKKQQVIKKSKYNENIAILMVSQYKRAPFIPLLFECIANQTYPRELIKEFVIVDGSKDELDQPIYEEWLKECNKLYNFPIKYINTIGDIKNVGHLRNLSLENVSNNKNIKYLIHLDDDDYQFPQRFESTIKAFKKYNTHLVGCNDQYMYDFNTDTTLRFRRGVFGLNHSVNSSLACSYEYGKTHKYDDDKTFAEENSFLNDFKEPMAQLNSNENIIGFSYGDGNTYNKIDIVIGNIFAKDDAKRTADVYIQDGLIEKLIGKKTFEKWINVIKQVSKYEEESKYDITYFTTNGHGIEWTPYDTSLGGSEHHIQEITKYWAKSGAKVVVYCNLKGDEKEITYEGVDYKHYKLFNYRQKHKILIFWRHIGIFIFESLKFKADQIYCDWHDNAQIQFEIAGKNHERLTGVCVKTQYHHEVGKFLSRDYNNFPSEKVNIIANGVRIETFNKNYHEVEKSRYNCVYASSYVRGLIPFLQYSLPIITKQVPEFKIHICYGMENETSELQNHLRLLFQQDGVFEYGKLNKDDVARLKWSCGFHLYPCLDPIPETFCITQLESYLTRTIPVNFNVALFKQLPSIHVNVDDIPQKGLKGEELFKEAYERYGQSVVDLLKNTTDEELENIRNHFEKYPVIQSWEQVANSWLDMFEKNKTIENVVKEYEII